ncbi:hypothetical protein D3C80_1802940 [compost metagenome]
MRPPAALLALPGILQPGFRGLGGGRRRVVERLGVARRVYQTLQVAGVGQHVGCVLAKQPGGAVAALPGGDVVGGAAHHIGAHLHLGHVDRLAGNLQGARVAVGVLLDQVEVVRVQLGG